MNKSINKLKIFLNLISWTIFLLENYKSVRYPNGSWTGHVGAVQRSEADMIGSVAYRTDRKTSVDFLNVICKTR